MVVPGHVVLGFLEQPGLVFLKGGDVIEGVDPIQVAGVDQGHEQVPGVCAMLGLEEVTVFAVKDGLFEGLFTCK